MEQSIRKQQSRLEMNNEIIFTRGIRAFKTSCLIIQLFGSCLLIISILQTILGDYKSMFLEWELFSLGLFFLTLGSVLKGNKGFANLFSIKSKAFSRRRSICIRLILFLILSFILLVKYTSVNVDTYKSYFFGEGGIVEWIQVLILLVSIRLGVLISTYFYKQEKCSLGKIIYVFITCLLFIITLEELSWGQVIFGWRTPHLLNALNAQGETTFHNLYFFQAILDISFLLITFFVFISVLARKYYICLIEKELKLSNHYLIRIIYPPAYTLELFLTTVLISFFVVNPLDNNLIINRDQEWAELFFYSGIFISLLRTYILLGNKTNR